CFVSFFSFLCVLFSKLWGPPRFTEGVWSAAPVVYKRHGLNLNQYGVASPCRTICTVCGFVALS
ncbi:hypothetical protein COH93_09305, partial [Neisseria meningitidis]